MFGAPAWSRAGKSGQGRSKMAKPIAPTITNGTKNIAIPDFCPRVSFVQQLENSSRSNETIALVVARAPTS
jgi:hypothetical protein